MSAPLEASKCRTCLQECSQYHQLEELLENNIKIVEMLDEIVPQIRIKLSSQFSHLVCDVCVDKLLNGYKFQQLCIETNKRLHDMLGRSPDACPTTIEAMLRNVYDPLTGVEDIEIKEEQIDNVHFDCEVAVNVKLNDGWKSDGAECAGIAADCEDTHKSDENLLVLRDDCKFDKPFMGSASKSCSQNIRRKISLPCTECGKVFNRLDSLKRHASVHAKKRASKSLSQNNRRKISLPCTECGKVFNRQDSLKRHASVHAKKRAYSCDICKHTCASENLYVQHMRIHEKETNDESNKRVLSCGLCPESFENKSLLIQHTQGHIKCQKKESMKDGKTRQNKSNSLEQTEEKDLSFILAKKLHYDKDEKSTLSIKQEVEVPHHKDNEDRIDNETDSDNTEDEDYDSDNCSKSKSSEPETADMEKTGNYPCDVCGEVFDRHYRLKRHSSVHSLERSHPCELCTYRFATLNLLKNHMVQHEGESGSNLAQTSPDGFKCPDCPRRFETHASLSAHRQIHKRSTSDVNYSCVVCQSNFVSVRSLVGHITNKHRELEKHKCDQCDESFVLHSQLVEHVNIHKGNKNLVCHICEKEFGYKNTLKEHMRTHSSASSYLCPQCGKTFVSTSGLSQHMRRHVGLKKFQCPECPSRFNCSSDLTKHMSMHRNVKPHECNVCGSRFTRAYSLLKHKSLHSGERPYKCKECDMTFATKHTLNRHMRTHTGEKPYKCKYCERSYAESGDLTKHLRTHVGENTYICDQCPLAFKYLAELRQHVAEHYRIAHIQQMSEESQTHGKIEN